MISIQTPSIQFSVLFFVSDISAQTFEVTRTDVSTPVGCDSGTDCSMRKAIIATNEVSGFLYISSDSIFMYLLSVFTEMREKSFEFTNYQSI